MIKWQPIETAPKDDTDIFVYIPLLDEMRVAFFGTEGKSPWPELVGKWILSDTMGEDDNTPDGYVWQAIEPSHWMPLPSRPDKYAKKYKGEKSQ